MKKPQHLIKLLTEERERGVIVWILNIGAEKFWNQVNPGVTDLNENRIVARMEEMNILLCREQDILILREFPEESYLRTLRELGFSIPTIWVPEQSEASATVSQLILKDNAILDALGELAYNNEEVWFVPYAVTKLEEEIARRCGLKLLASESVLNARINDKIGNRVMAEELGLDVSAGKVCHSIEEIHEEYNRLTTEPFVFQKVIIKEPFGASGKGLYIIDNSKKLSPVLASFKRYAKRNADAKWLVEGWQTKLADLNFQLYISPEGDVELFSMKEQVLRDTIYIGSKMPADIKPEWVETFQEVGEKIGRRLYESGYYGIAGVDSIITTDQLIIPIVEINGRFTLSTYISFISGILGNKKYYSRYFKMISLVQINYELYCSILDKEGILYTQDRKEGVFVYTAGTLPVDLDKESGTYIGRAFTLIIAHDWSRVEEIDERLEHVMSKFSTRQFIQ